MTLQLFSLVLLAAIFVVGTWKPIHLGLLALVAAFGLGVLIDRQTYEELLSGFPVSLFVLLLGVTWLFSIAKEAGVVEWIIAVAIRLIRGRVALIPWLFLVLAMVLGSMGSALTSLALAPFAMAFASSRRGLHPMLMALTIIIGGGMGGFAPTSLFGMVINDTAERSGITPEPWRLFITAVVLGLVLFAVAFVMFHVWPRRHGNARLDRFDLGGAGGPSAPVRVHEIEAIEATSGTGTSTVVAERTVHVPTPTRMGSYQWVSLFAICALLVIVVTLTVADKEFDVGFIALGLALVVSLLYPQQTAPAIKGVDWSTILLVGGMLSYIGVIQRMGTIDMLGDAAHSVGSPLVAALALCLVGAFVSYFASTTGIIGVLIPLALPMVASGALPGFPLIMALGFSSNLVDSAPFSSPGAVTLANAEPEDRPALARTMLRWGFSMIFIAPVLTVVTMVVPAMYL